jgi:hypothetical protein
MSKSGVVFNYLLTIEFVYNNQEWTAGRAASQGITVLPESMVD